MGTSQSLDSFDLADSDSDPYTEEEEDGDEQEQYDDAEDQQKPQISSVSQANSKSPVEVDAKLKSLKLKYGASFSPSSLQNLYSTNSVKLYLHISGNTPKAKWIVSDKHVSYSFVRTFKIDGEDDVDEPDGAKGQSWWVLKVRSKVRARVLIEMHLKLFG